jgi:KDO2-lipid IV(A) lauroyltransferase
VKKNRLKRLQEAVQGYVAIGIYNVCSALPLGWTSRFCGFLGRAIGPKLRVSRLAEANLRRAFPQMTLPEAQVIVHDMWDHFLRVFGEYAHAKTFKRCMKKYITFSGKEKIVALARTRKPIIFVTGHYGHFQLVTLLLQSWDIEVTQLYRSASNPYVDHLMQRAQHQFVSKTLPKGRKSIREMLSLLKAGKSLFILIDQYAHDGTLTQFFNLPTRTALSAAVLAKKFDCALVPVFCTRVTKERFSIDFEDPIDLAFSEKYVMEKVQVLLEKRIHNQPHQWFWLHNRWKNT